MDEAETQELLNHLRNTLRYAVEEMEVAGRLQLLDEPLNSVLASLRQDLETLEAIVGEPDDLL